MSDAATKVFYAQGWTVADLDRLPDDDDRRYELFDGVVSVAPSPSDEHQEAAGVLWAILRAAAPAGLRATHGVGVVISQDNFLVPDVLVVRGDTPRRRGDFPASDVLLAVEVVSPSTRSQDRWRKPSLYAQAGIPSYWRVELDPLHVVAYRLDVDGFYAEHTRADAGYVFSVAEPFRVEFDPGDLLP